MLRLHVVPVGTGAGEPLPARFAGVGFHSRVALAVVNQGRLEWETFPARLADVRPLPRVDAQVPVHGALLGKTVAHKLGKRGASRACARARAT